MLSNRYVVLSCLFILAAVVFIVYTAPHYDNDLWWHMELGEYLVKNLTLKPDHSIYSWTVADPNWVYNGWLPQIFFYFVYSIGGTTALHVVLYIFLLLIISLFLYYNRIIQKPLVNIFSLFAILLIMVASHLNIALLRPEIFSTLFLTVTVFIYFYCIITRRNLFYLYPVIMLLWVNSHGVFIFGMAFIVVAFIGESVNYYVLRKSPLSRELIRKFFFSVILSFIALLITPYGHRWIVSIITSFSDPQFMRQAEFLAAYKSIFVFAHPAKYILVGAAGIYVLASIYLLAVKKYFNLPITLVNALFIYFSFMYGRSAYFYLPVWYFSMGYYAYLLSSEDFKDVRLNPILKKAVSLIVLVTYIVLSVYVVHWTIYYPLMYRYFGFGIGEYMPDKVSDFLLQHKLEGPLFNTYEIGGYLLWRLYPHYKVFIDPRHGPYAKHIMDAYKAFEYGNNFEVFTARYPFKLAVVRLQWIYLFTNFFKSPDWRLVYFDQSSALFAHKDVKLPNVNIDLGVDRFKDIKSYESLMHVMYVYLNMNDFKSVWYIMDLAKNRYNYGRFKEKIDLTVEKIKNFETQKGITGEKK